MRQHLSPVALPDAGCDLPALSRRATELEQEMRALNAEDQMRATELRNALTGLVMGLPRAMVIWRNNYIVHANPSFCSMLGVTEQELDGKPWHHFVHPEDLEESEDRALAAMREHSHLDGFENRWRTADGSWVRIRWFSSPTDANGWALAQCEPID